MILSRNENFKARSAIDHGNELCDELYERCFEHYCNNGEMPYGTAKARTGDPYEWVLEKLEVLISEQPLVGHKQPWC